MRFLKSLRLVLLAAALAIPTVAFTSGSVFAYGHADQPLAQLEISGNCDNPNNYFCSNVVGVGGIWLWIEIDANGTGDVAGSGCGHTVGGPRGGAESIRGDVTWETSMARPRPTTGSASRPSWIRPTATTWSSSMANRSSRRR